MSKVQMPDPFGYFCDWGDSESGQRIAMYWGEPGSATADDWNEYPKVHCNVAVYDATALAQAEARGRQQGYEAARAAEMGLLEDARHRIANLSRAAIPFNDPLDGPVLRRLDAAIDAARQPNQRRIND